MTKDYCKVYCKECGQEMRKWIVKDQCVAMCITDKCVEQGTVHRAIEDISNFKIDVLLKI